MSTNPSRRVIVTGDDDALTALAPTLNGPIFLVEDRDGWAVTAPEIDAAPTPSAAMEEADVIVAQLSGLARLVLGRAITLNAESLVAVWDDGRRDVHIFMTGSIMASAVLVAGAGTVIGGDPAPAPPKSLTEIAIGRRHEEAVALVLELLARPQSWTNLNKILEAIEGDVGEPGWRRYLSKGRQREFTNAANAYENALDGRHARKDYRLSPGKDPMSLRDGEHLVIAVVKAWLRDKG